MTILHDAVFWVSIATLVIGAYRFSLSQAYRSKCSRCHFCWGMLTVDRNVEIERQIDEHAMELEETKEPTTQVV